MRFGNTIETLLSSARAHRAAGEDLPIDLTLALMDMGYDPRDL